MECNMHTTEINSRAVMMGVFAALVAAIILNLLGAGIGLASAAGQPDAEQLWGAFGVWAVSGIISAFIGGYVAGALAVGTRSPGLHGLASWAISTVLVVAAAGFAASAGGTAMLAGPAYIPNPTDDVRDAMGTMALASAIALIIGAAAAYIGARSAARGVMHHDTNAGIATHTRAAM
jgi:heme/copper-type cytochrome/quinol oxidase subunit 2